MSIDILRQELSKYACKIVDKGLVVGPGGNISARFENTMLLSPSGFDLSDIEPSQWVAVNIDNGEVDGALRPSSEILMHLACYQKQPDIGSVVHTHPPYSIAMSTIIDEVPILFPDQAALVGQIGFVPYVLPTTNILAEVVCEKLQLTPAVLLGNHGLVTVGRNLREAFYRTQICESTAMIYLLANIVREPRNLTSEEVEEIRSLEAEDYRIALLKMLGN